MPGGRISARPAWSVAGVRARRRHEVNAVRIDLDDLRAELLEPRDHVAKQRPSARGHIRRGVVIGKAGLRKAKVTVHRVDENLERLLERLEAGARGGRGGGAHLLLGLEAIGAQIGEDAAENPELVRRRQAAELEHEARVKRRDVAMPDIARDAGEKNVRVAPLERARLRQIGQRMPPAQVLAKEEGVGLGGAAAHDHVLVIVGKNLRLDEIAGAERLGQRARLLERGAGRDMKMGGDVGEVERLEYARGDIVELGEQVGVDEMASGGLVLGIADRLFGDLDARGAARERRAVAAPEQLHLRVARMGGDAGQDFFEKIVPFYDIRVALADEQGEPLEFGTPEGFAPAGGIGEDGSTGNQRRSGAGASHSIPAS